MLSYHNDPAVKQKYVERFAAHRAIDAVIQGTGYDAGYKGLGKGCFVGCVLQSYDHSRFPAELGWPEWLARLADTVFEGLPKDEAAQFGTDLLSAVPVGVDLEPVKHHLTIARMDRLIELQTRNAEYDATDVIAAIRAVRRCAEAELQGDVCDWSAARSAAWSAAESAARSAAWSAAESAESAAESAAGSARSAAASAAWSVARSAAFQQERDSLLQVLRSL